MDLGTVVGTGASWTRDRMEEEMCSLEKPRTMLVELNSVVVVSLEANGGLMSVMSDLSLFATVPTVDGPAETGTGYAFDRVSGYMPFYDRFDHLLKVNASNVLLLALVALGKFEPSVVGAQ
jgi:hypothetical protein